jgi:hypothetical protein
VRFTTDLPGNVKLAHVTIDRVDAGGFRNYGVTVGGTVDKSGFADVRITRVTAHDNGQGGIATGGKYSTAVAAGYANRNVYVGHCVAYNNPGIAGFASHSGNGIVLSDAQGGVIEYSQAYNNGAANTHVGGPVGIWVWDVDGFVLQHNESHHNRTNSRADGGGFDLDGGVTNSVMQYNYSHDNDGAGYGIYQFNDARPFHTNTVRYNLSENDGRKNGYAGIDFWNGGSGIRDVDVYNNTVKMSPASGGPRAIRFQTGTTNVRLRNNNIVVTGGVQLLQVAALRNQSGLVFQGNNWFASGGAFAINWNAKKYGSLAAFRSGTGQETLAGKAVGTSVDPQFVNPLGGSRDAYRLQPTSPLATAGLNLWALFNIDPGTQDLFGDPLPEKSATATYSIGADQVGSTGATF